MAFHTNRVLNARFLYVDVYCTKVSHLCVVKELGFQASWIA